MTKPLTLRTDYIRTQYAGKPLATMLAAMTRHARSLETELQEQRGTNWKYIQALSEILTILPSLKELESVKALGVTQSNTND